MRGRLSSWRPGRPDAEARLDEIAEDALATLHRTLRADPSAFGLYEAACAAGERLTAVMDTLAPGREADPDTFAGDGRETLTEAGADDSGDGTDFAARFVRAVGGEGGTVADATVRRAAAVTAGRVARQDAGALARGGSDWSGDLLCLLYQWFFADVVTEFLRVAVAEQVKLVVPVLPAADPEDRVADWIAEQVLHLVPSPCEEAAHLAEAAERGEGEVTALEDPADATLAQVARGLVPRAVGAALGLLPETDGDAWIGASTGARAGPGAMPSEGTSAA
ncbi:hypothetical protein [Streptomyces sp. NPDC102283]|uniref:hypothetical protein n=1 Tax=Streptomyces sp. NPDC102283 TaxID=3366155 RepID=UPI003801B379